MSRDIEKFLTTITGTTHTRKPSSTSSTDGRSNSNSFHISYSCWTAKNANISRKGWLQAWLSLFSFKRFNESCFFTTDIGSCTPVHKHIKGISRVTCIWAKETSFVSFIDCNLHVRSFIVEFTTDIYIRSSSSHSSACN